MFRKVIGMIILLSLVNVVFGQLSQHRLKKDYKEEENDKLKQAEELADRFVRRWHETLDLKVVFNELFVTNPSYLSQNYHLYSKVEDCNGCTEEMIKEAYFSYQNAFALRKELALVYGTSDDGECRCPVRFLQALKSLEKSLETRTDETQPRGIDAMLLQEMISFDIKWVQLAREILPLSRFSSVAYKARYKKYYEDERSTVNELESEINRQGLLIEIDENTPAYDVKRGVFEFFIIEEDGKFKVLSLDRPE